MSTSYKHFLTIFLLIIFLNTFGQRKPSYNDTLIVSVTGDTALTIDGILSLHGEEKTIHFSMYSKNNKKEINFISIPEQSATYRENVSLLSLIPKDILETYNLRYFAVFLPNDTLANKDIEINTTILKTRVGAIDKAHKDTIYYCKIKQEIKHHGVLLHERKVKTALLYKSLEYHFDTKLYKWYCPQLHKYVISARFEKIKYDKKSENYKGIGTSRVLFN